MTFFNKHTIDEVQNLLTNKDNELGSLENAWRGFDKTWMAFDPNSDNGWVADFNALKGRYSAARGAALQAVALSEGEHLPNNMIASEDEYRGLVNALQRQPGLVSPGDFQDLWQRLQNAINSHASATGIKPSAIPEPVMVQPAKSDVDLAYMKYSGEAANVAKGIARQSANVLLPGVVPGLQAASYLATRAAAPPAPEKKGWGTGKLLLLGGGLTLGAIAALKIGWRVLKPF